MKKASTNNVFHWDLVVISFVSCTLTFLTCTFLVAQTVKCLSTMLQTWFDPWVGKIRWRRKWQSTPVLLPGKSHGQRSLVGYSPRGRKESDMTERLHLHFFTFLPLPSTSKDLLLQLI